MADRGGFGDIEPHVVPNPVSASPDSDSPSPPMSPGPLQVEEHNASANLEYYDVMIVGMTGQGKSTTSDKMIVASADPVEQAKEPDMGDNEPEFRDEKLSVNDFTFWAVGSTLKGKEVPIKDYLKTLDFFRYLDTPHLKVNEAREDGDINPMTSSCQLVSNEVTKMRVLDVPGFFGTQLGAQDSQKQDVDDPLNLEGDIYENTLNHIKVMRDILRIQSAMEMHFKRILYFLPIRGPLEKSSRVLTQELLLLARFFGRPIFECMVLVATAQTRFSLMPELQGRLFSDGECEMTRTLFHKALKEVVFPKQAEGIIPNPPLIFISMMDECNAIVEKVKKAKVRKNALELTFDRGVCIKCSCTIKWLEDEKVECITSIPGQAGTHSNAIPYGDSLCHPIFLPKHGRLENIEVEDGMHLLVIRKSQKLPDALVEVCHNCGRGPGSVGCMMVRKEKYEIEVDGKTVKLEVDHSNQLEQHRILRQTMDVDEGTDSDLSDDGYDERIRSGGPARVSEAIDSGGVTSEFVPGTADRHAGLRHGRRHAEQTDGRGGRSLLQEAGIEELGDRKG